MAATSAAYAFLSPALGWVGTAVAGSATSAGALFANLQATAAQGAGLDPKILLAANTIGGGLGKIVSPQNLAIASTAVDAPGSFATPGAPCVCTRAPTSDRGRTSQPRTAISHRRLRPGTRILEANAVLATKVRPRSKSALSTASTTLLPRPVRSPSQIRAVTHDAIRF